MIYIKFPKGWTFEKKEIGGEPTDILKRTLDKGTEIINLQHIIKECLRHKKRYAKSVSIKGEETKGEEITIYFRHPPFTTDVFLKYLPNNNGKFPSTETHNIQGFNAKPKYVTTHYGSLWFQNDDTRGIMTAERLQEVIEKAKEIQDNRRHIGDAPKAT